MESKQIKTLYRDGNRWSTRNPNESVESDLPVLPYNGSSGWSGTDTSKERADNDDLFGNTSARQQYVLNLLRARGAEGATWREVADLSMMHHGQASSALSTLHKADKIARLTEKRDKCRVYVLHEYVYERETDSQGRKPKACPNCGYVND